MLPNIWAEDANKTMEKYGILQEYWEPWEECRKVNKKFVAKKRKARIVCSKVLNI